MSTPFAPKRKFAALGIAAALFGLALTATASANQPFSSWFKYGNDVETNWDVQGDPAKTTEVSIRDVMKLRGEIRVVPSGTIPPGAKKIDDRRTWD